MRVERQSESGNYLKVKDVEDKRITELKIVSELREVEFENKDNKTGNVVVKKKYQCDVEYAGFREGDPNIWTLNASSVNILIDTWGDESSNWLNKPIPLSVQGEGEYRHFKVDKLRIKR